MKLEGYINPHRNTKIEMKSEHRKVLMDICKFAFLNKRNFVRDIENTEVVYRAKYDEIKEGKVEIRNVMWCKKQALSCKAPPNDARYIYQENKSWIDQVINNPREYESQHFPQTSLTEFFNNE